MPAKVAFAQINVTVGDLAGNAALIERAAHAAHAAGAAVLLTPELALTGYPPEDLVMRRAFMEATARTLRELAVRLAVLPGLSVVVGHPAGGDDRTRSITIQQRHNAASVLAGGKVAATYAKRELPNYQVFDEKRYFAPGAAPLVFEAGGVRFGLLICEDAWFAGPARDCQAAGAEALLVINASPYHMGKTGERVERMRQRVTETGLPLVFAHSVGGQDEVVFDGSSFALDGRGDLVARLPMFEEALGVVTIDGARVSGTGIAPEPGIEAQVYAALKLGVADYVRKNGFPGAIIGLSGGIDSALTLALACDALGPERVRAVMMPSQYTADISWLDSREMVARLGVRYDEIAIRPMYDAFERALAADFAGRKPDTTEENLQARIRGTLLMALSNKHGSIVLTTGNKSEMAVGYCTLYGDMAGGFAVIKDIAKTLVYRLAAYRNSLSYVIPERIITRAPSAELRPDQKDQDSLPPYEVLDAILAAYVEEDLSPAEIVARGHPQADVDRVVRLIRISEYKRRQAPVGVRVTHRAFGRDWRMPIVNRYRDD
ncbi:MAG: NAD+ synthase [Burkholderiales bacterium]|nr:NAD+ synthase [Burkholderiales bacterium]